MALTGKKEIDNWVQDWFRPIIDFAGPYHYS
jgi:hypothetical protein